MSETSGHEWVIRARLGQTWSWHCRRCGGYRSEWAGTVPNPDDGAWVQGWWNKCSDAIVAKVLGS